MAPIPVFTPYTGSPARSAVQYGVPGGRRGGRGRARGTSSTSVSGRSISMSDRTEESRVQRVSIDDQHVSGICSIVPTSAASARRRIRWAIATSSSDSPRCQKRLRSASFSRPGFWPATIWPSSAYRVSGDSRPVSTCRRSDAEPARLRLAPVVDDHLVHHVEQIQLDRADRAVRDDEGAGLDGRGTQEWFGFGQPGRFDQHVGAVERLLRGRDHPDRRGQLRGQFGGELLPRLGPARRHPDLVQVEEIVEHGDVPPRRTASAGVGEDLAVRPGQVPGADRRHRAGPRRGDHGRVEHRERYAGGRVEQRRHRQLARQARPGSSGRSRRPP